MVEALYCELYSCLDGLRRTIFGIYRGCRGVQKDSTNKLFRKAEERGYGPEFPEEIRLYLETSWKSWFPDLREIRSEITHGEVGSCSLDDSDKTVRYFQHGMQRQGRSLIVPNVVSVLNDLRVKIFELLDCIFGVWVRQLEYREVTAVCGVWKARFYERRVGYNPALSFHSGECGSANWFKDEPEYACPLRETCGAYARREDHLRELAWAKWVERGRPLWEFDVDWKHAEADLKEEYLKRYNA